MRVAVKYTFGQLLLFLFLVCMCACSARKEEISIIPPVTSPLARDYIGFGVITSSFTHITAEPLENSPSLGYLRRGSLVRIVRRQIVRTQNSFVTWVLIDGNVNGWLKEEVMDIYNSERQARTAAESIP
jgi:hypothetical protein